MADRSIYLVQTNAVSGREDEFNDWYTNRHLGDVLSVDGWVAAQRFELTAPTSARAPAYPYRYLAVYEVDGDPQSSLRALSSAVRGGMEISEAMAEERSAHLFVPITPRITSDSLKR